MFGCPREAVRVKVKAFAMLHGFYGGLPGLALGLLGSRLHRHTSGL